MTLLGCNQVNKRSHALLFYKVGPRPTPSNESGIYAVNVEVFLGINDPLLTCILIHKLFILMFRILSSDVPTHYHYSGL